MIATTDLDLAASWSADLVNPLQRVISEAMAARGMPLEQRGSKAELARRSGVSETIIGYIFNRVAYLPDERHRAALAKALHVRKADIDAAGAAIKGLRVHSTGPSVLRDLDEARTSLLLSSDDLSPAELRAARKKLEALAREVSERLRSVDPNA